LFCSYWYFSNSNLKGDHFLVEKPSQPLSGAVASGTRIVGKKQSLKIQETCNHQKIFDRRSSSFSVAPQAEAAQNQCYKNPGKQDTHVCLFIS
jgi:hypothetical protein